MKYYLKLFLLIALSVGCVIYIQSCSNTDNKITGPQISDNPKVSPISESNFSKNDTDELNAERSEGVERVKTEDDVKQSVDANIQNGEYPDKHEKIIDGFTLKADKRDKDKGTNQETSVAGSRATYAYGVIPWYDRNSGDNDWMVIFYLPYNPGIANFEGLTYMWIWTNFNSWVQIYDARWTSGGFRVMILMGNKVRYLCGTSPSRYRLVY